MLEHNHPLAKSEIEAQATFPEYQHIDASMSEYLYDIDPNNDMRPFQMRESLNNKFPGRDINITAIYNFKQSRKDPLTSKNTIEPLVLYLADNDYIVHYETKRDGHTLKSLFVAHPDNVAMAQRFREVVLLDATYKTNAHNMPFVNVVGVSNVGETALRTFLIACVLVSQENAKSYDWVTEKLKQVVWRRRSTSTQFVCHR